MDLIGFNWILKNNTKNVIIRVLYFIFHILMKVFYFVFTAFCFSIEVQTQLFENQYIYSNFCFLLNVHCILLCTLFLSFYWRLFCPHGFMYCFCHESKTAGIEKKSFTSSRISLAINISVVSRLWKLYQACIRYNFLSPSSWNDFAKKPAQPVKVSETSWW